MSEGEIAAMLASIAEIDERMTGMLLDANVPGLPQASFPASALSINLPRAIWYMAFVARSQCSCRLLAIHKRHISFHSSMELNLTNAVLEFLPSKPHHLQHCHH